MQPLRESVTWELNYNVEVREKNFSKWHLRVDLKGWIGVIQIRVEWEICSVIKTLSEKGFNYFLYICEHLAYVNMG